MTNARETLCLALLAGTLAAWNAEAMSECRDTAREACLLDGRIQTTVTLRDDKPAWAIAGEAETGLFSATDQGEATVSVQVLDGRAVNGYFWLLYNTLTEEEVTIEIVDRVTGNRRRVVKEAGGPASNTMMEALSASATVVGVSLDTARAVTKAISTAGGSITVLDAQGTRFVVAFPADALNLTTDITVTPVVAIDGLPFSGGLHGAVRIEPEGIIPARAVCLTITPKPAVAAAQQLSFAFHGLDGELFLTPPLVKSKTLVVPIHRLGGYGLGAGSSADLAAQLLSLPTGAEDRLNQRLAGLLLPVRRAGKKTVPATVEPLLLAEFNARIKPKLAALAKGNVDKNYAEFRNWSLAASDTGLAKEVEAGAAQGASASERAARVKGSRLDLDRYLKICIEGKQADAMPKAFRAFSELTREKAAKAGDSERIKRCARFQLGWNTEITIRWVDEDAEFKHGTRSSSKVLLAFDQGNFVGGNAVTQSPIFVAIGGGCSGTRIEGPPPVTLAVNRLDFAALNNFGEGFDTQVYRPVIYYDFPERAAPERFSIACPKTPVQVIEMDWLGLYFLKHLRDLALDGQYFKAPLSPQAGVYGVKVYQGPEENLITEVTALFLEHKP